MISRDRIKYLGLHIEYTNENRKVIQTGVEMLD